jgi:hypothetical protein
MTITEIIKALRKTKPVDLITTLDDLIEEYNLTKCEDSESVESVEI